MNNSTFWIAIAREPRRSHAHQDRCDRRAGCKTAPFHLGLGPLLGSVTPMVLVVVAVRR